MESCLLIVATTIIKIIARCQMSLREIWIESQSFPHGSLVVPKPIWSGIEALSIKATVCKRNLTVGESKVWIEPCRLLQQSDSIKKILTTQSDMISQDGVRNGSFGPEIKVVCL